MQVPHSRYYRWFFHVKNQILICQNRHQSFRFLATVSCYLSLMLFTEVKKKNLSKKHFFTENSCYNKYLPVFGPSFRTVKSIAGAPQLHTTSLSAIALVIPLPWLPQLLLLCCAFRLLVVWVAFANAGFGLTQELYPESFEPLCLLFEPLPLRGGPESSEKWPFHELFVLFLFEVEPFEAKLVFLDLVLWVFVAGTATPPPGGGGGGGLFLVIFTVCVLDEPTKRKIQNFKLKISLDFQVKTVKIIKICIKVLS